MKKFSIKSLLVLVLVLVLVLSIGLVACNKKKNNNSNPSGGGNTPAPTPGPEPSGGIDKDSYFGNLWNLASDIGSEAITANDNVALSLDLSVALRQMKAGRQVEDGMNFNIGIALDVILDRTSRENGSASAKNSAVKALLYNADNGETWCAIYYFLSEPNYVYFDLNFAKNIDFMKDNDILQKRYYKVAFDTDYQGNATYPGSVADFINNHRFAQKEDEEGNIIEDSGFSIADVVSAVVAGTGANWSLNTLIENIAGIFDLDLKGIAKKIQTFFPGMYDEATNSIHIENALSSKIFKGFLNDPTETEKDGRKEYAITLNVGKVLSLASDMLKDLPDIVKMVLNENTEFSLKYGEKNGKLDGFAIIVGLKGMMDAKTNVYPEVELSINNLELRKGATTAAAAKTAVGFTANNWANADTLNVNNMLNCEATMEVELWGKDGTVSTDDGKYTPYLVTAYSDIDLIDVIETAIKMSKEDRTWAQRADLLKTIDGEIGLKVEELDAEGKFVVKDGKHVIPFQLLASCEAGELSAVVGDKTYVIDVYDILSKWNTIEWPQFSSGEGDDDDEGQDADAMSTVQGIMDAFDIIKETVKINGAELSLDAVKAIFFDENGELKENWHEFTLDANFTKKICDDICAKFGATNDNEVSVNIQKTANKVTAVAQYLNDAGVDGQGKAVKDQYFVNIECSWDLEENSLSFELKFNMWDEDAAKKVTYDCKYEGALVFDEFEATEEEPAYKLLKSGNAKLELTRQYDEENSIPEPIFVAELEGAINYNAAKDSITSATLELVVTKDGVKETAEETIEYFHINGALTVSSKEGKDGKVLVKFTDDGYEYEATDGVIVDTTITETLVAWLCQLDVDQDGTDVQIKDYKLPANILAALKKAGLVEDEVTELNIGQLLGACNINAEDANVIRTHYEYNALANDVTQVLFTIGLNETETKTMHLGFELRRSAEGMPTYVKCVYNLGEGDTGLALRLDTWTTDWQGDYAGQVTPLRTDAGYPAGAEVLDASNIAEAVAGIMGKLAPVMQLFM